MPWDIVTVDTSADQGVKNRATLAFSPRTGEPSIAYTDAGSVKYAQRTLGTWHHTVVAAGPSNQDAHFAFDGAGNPIIVYREYVPCPAHTYCAWGDAFGLTWNKVPIVAYSKCATISFPSGSKDPRFAYIDYSCGCVNDLRYASFDIDTWNFTTIDALPPGCRQATQPKPFFGCEQEVHAFAFTTRSPPTPYIAYTTFYPSGTPPSIAPSTPFIVLKVAYLDQESHEWEIMVVFEQSQGTSGVSLALNPKPDITDPWITYADFDHNSLICAHAGYIGHQRVWWLDIVATTDIPLWQKKVGLYSSLALKPRPGSDACDPCIAYITSERVSPPDPNQFRNTLNYATKESGTWSTTVVDSAEGGAVNPEPLTDPCLAFDPSGAPAISYRDNSAKTLKYAHFRS
ncbi:MAG: hypothetical protein ACXV5H_11115 [Halobacteriota archaeon]